MTAQSAAAAGLPRNDPRKRPRYAPKNQRGAPRMIYFDKDEATADKIMRALRRNGCCIVKNLVPARIIDKVMGELNPYLEKTPKGSGDFVGFHTRRTSGIVAKSPTAGEQLAMHPLVLEVVDKLLLDRCQHYHLSPTQIVSIGPGETLQPLHRDDAIYPFKHPSKPSVVTTIWAMTDFTEENGATQCTPGSHKWDDKRVPKRHDVVQAVMPKGSCFFYDGAIYHGGAENYTREWRSGIILGYALGWLRQEENQFLVAPPEVAKKLPEKLQKLIGYQLHAPYLGWYEMNDPILLLKDQASATMSASDLTEANDSKKTLRTSVRRT